MLLTYRDVIHLEIFLKVYWLKIETKNADICEEKNVFNYFCQKKFFLRVKKILTVFFFVEIKKEGSGQTPRASYRVKEFFFKKSVFIYG